MKRTVNGRTRKAEADSQESARLIARLVEIGLSQSEIAEHLGISEGQLSRAKSGERPVAAKHLSALQRLLDSRSARRHMPPFALSNAVLSLLSPTEATDVFRNLLLAEAARHGIPKTSVSVSSQNSVADGGIDASILGEVQTSADSLLAGNARFQIKTGDVHPWRMSWVNRELFEKRKPHGADALGSAVRRCLDDGARYCLVCFGVDPTDENLRKAHDNFKSTFEMCGYAHAKVSIWGQSQLLSALHQYPSLCMRVLGHDQGGFQTHDSWSRNADMEATLHVSPEQQSVIDELKEQLLTGAVHHVRLVGEPGVGKTRLALEITRGDLAAVVLYFRDAASFQARNDLIYELIQPDDRRFLVLVVDECGPKDRASIWNLLRSHAGKVRLITIDHGPDDSVGAGVQIVHVPATSKEQIAAIIRDYGVPPLDADRWAEFCEGCPRVAHVIGENLHHNRADVLQSPAYAEVWDRFIVGRDDPASEDVVLRKIALMHIALYERFGFEYPVSEEADFIAAMACRRDERLTRGRFREIVLEMKRRRILQGVTTIYLTPRLLQIYLYRKFWETYGSGFDIADTLRSMPPQIRRWFVEMLRYGDEQCPNAMTAVDRLLGSSGWSSSAEFADTNEHGRLVMALAEANRKAVLKYLWRTLISGDGAGCQPLAESRQYILWALERIVAYDDCFIGGAELLLFLAEAEAGAVARGATEMFSSLFHPAWGQTEASFERRLPVLRSAIDSDSPKTREIAIRACKAALMTHGGFRVVGAEHQGVRRSVEFWAPHTYAELWDAYRNVWQLLVEKLSLWEGEDRRKLLAMLIESAWSMLQTPVLAADAVATLETVATDPLTNITSLLCLIKRQLRFNEGKLKGELAARLRRICEQLDGQDFSSKLRRFVKFATVDDSYDEQLKATNLVDRKLDECADEAYQHPQSLRNELSWLVCEDSSPAYVLALKIAQRDLERQWLPELLRFYQQEGDRAGSSFLSGYLAAIRARDSSEWERCMLKLADCRAVNARYSDFVIGSGLSDAVVRKVIELCRGGVQAVERLERWWFSRQLSELSEDIIADLVEMQIQCGSARLWASAVQMWHTYFLQYDRGKRLPEELTFALLADERVADENLISAFGYYWSRIAAVFMQQYAERKWDLFKAMLRIGMEHWRVLGDLDMHEERVFTTLLKDEPDLAWRCIAEIYTETPEQSRFGLRYWLGDGGPGIIGSEAPGPVQWLPKTLVLSWVNEDVDDRAACFASMLPKTLDHSRAGRLTRDFLAKYGRNKRAFHSLLARFQSRGWSGPASDHYRQLRDEAREWLAAENNATVIQWVEEYIECLTWNIRRAEIDEERAF